MGARGKREWFLIPAALKPLSDEIPRSVPDPAEPWDRGFLANLTLQDSQQHLPSRTLGRSLLSPAFISSSIKWGLLFTPGPFRVKDFHLEFPREHISIRAEEDGWTAHAGAPMSHTQSPGSPESLKWPPRNSFGNLAVEGRPLLDTGGSVPSTAFLWSPEFTHIDSP